MSRLLFAGKIKTRAKSAQNFSSKSKFYVFKIKIQKYPLKKVTKRSEIVQNSQKYYASEILGLRNIGSQKYRISEILGLRNIRS